MTLSTWLIGSYPDMPQQDFQASPNGNPLVGVTIDAGSYYLDHASGALSLCSQLQAALASAGIAGVDCRFLQNRKIEIFAIDTFEVVWPADGLLRTMLGFAGDLPGGSSSYIADFVSPYFWSGEKPVMWIGSPVNVLGVPVYDQQTSITPDGTVYSTGHYSLTQNEFEWRWVPLDRYQTSAGLGGEYVTYYDNVMRYARNFVLWFTIDENDASTLPVALPSGDMQGPFAMQGGNRALRPTWGRSPGFERLNRYQNVDMAVFGAREYVNS